MVHNGCWGLFCRACSRRASLLENVRLQEGNGQRAEGQVTGRGAVGSPLTWFRVAIVFVFCLKLPNSPFCVFLFTLSIISYKWKCESIKAAWRNGIASDYESGDCRFDPCGGQPYFIFGCITLLISTVHQLAISQIPCQNFEPNVDFIN